MPYTYKKMHLDRTAHNLKYKYGQPFTPTQITYHQTANNASALNERNYLNNRTDKTYIGFHLVVDDQEAIECLPLSIQTWHAGDQYGDGNMKSIGVEIAYSSSSDTTLKDNAIENAATLIANLMKTYQISLTNVYSHADRSGKHCPHDILDRYGEIKFRSLIQSEYNRLTNSTTSTPAIVDEFNVGDTVILSESIPGYISSGALIPSTTIKSGTYVIYQIVSGKRHPINISNDGNTAGSWGDVTKLYKPDSGFVVGDSVYVSTPTDGYVSSISSTSETTVNPGHYVVYKVANGKKHPVNISNDGKTAGSWVDADGLTLQTKPAPFTEGETVTVNKTIARYKTSIATKQAGVIKAGTYYIYKYIKDANHPLNITSKVGTPGSWVDTTHITK